MIPRGLKRCPRCCGVKPLGEFYRNGSAIGKRTFLPLKSSVQAYCKPCWNDYTRQYKALRGCKRVTIDGKRVWIKET